MIVTSSSTGRLPVFLLEPKARLGRGLGGSPSPEPNPAPPRLLEFPFEKPAFPIPPQALAAFPVTLSPNPELELFPLSGSPVLVVKALVVLVALLENPGLPGLIVS